MLRAAGLAYARRTVTTNCHNGVHLKLDILLINLIFSITAISVEYIFPGTTESYLRRLEER